MKRERFVQIQIWGWQARNNKWIYVILTAVFLVLIPALSAVFGRKTPLDEYQVVYGYVLYIAKTLTFGLGCVPLFMTMYICCHLEVGDCIVLSAGWDERKQCMISYAFAAVLYMLLMLCLAIIFHKGISLATFLKDLVSLLAVLWFLASVSYTIAALFHNVYLALILIELYGVLFWNMGIGTDAVWNVFSITGAEGVVWVMEMILYIAMGVILLEIVRTIKKKVMDVTIET